MVVQLLLTLGLMLLERLGFFERSAQEGNLSLAYRAHRTWVTGALLLLLVAGATAGLGPRRAAPPEPGRVTGNRMNDAAGPQRGSLPMEEQLRDAGAAIAAAAAAARAGSAPQAALLLLLLLALVALLLIWAFSRSRAARWLLAVVSVLLSRLLALWRRLLAKLRHLVQARREHIQPATPVPPWLRDPLFNIFEHADLLAVLSPREILIRTYHLLLNYGDMLGFGRRPGETPLEFRALSP